MITRKSAPRITGCLLALLLVAALDGPVRAAETGTSGTYVALTDSAMRMAKAHLQHSLESVASARTSRWENKSGPGSGYVTPLRTFKIKSGHFCRQFIEAVSGADGLRSRMGVACRHDKGRWIVVPDQAG